MLSQSKFRAIFMFSLIAVVGVFGFADALSQWQFNQDFKVSDNYVGIGKSHTPRVAMCNSGNSVAIWIEGGWSQEEELYFQLMDENNKPIGSSVRIVYPVISDEYTFDVDMNSIGDFSVVFANQETAGIFLKRFASDGTALSDLIDVNPKTSINSLDLRLDYAMNDDGSSVVVWENNRNSYKNIYGQYYNSDGITQGDNFQITDDSSNAENIRAVSMDDQGNFVLAWIDTTNGYSKLYGKQYDSSCNARGPKFLIYEWQDFDDFVFPLVTINDQGCFLVYWQKENQDLYGLLFDPQGNATGIQYQINKDNWERVDAVLFNDNSSVITWGYTEYQRFASDGSPIDGTGMAKVEPYFSYSTSNCIAGNDAKNFNIVWESSIKVIMPSIIYSQQFFSDGKRNGPNILIGRKIVSDIAQYRPALACNNSGKFLITWNDKRNESDWGDVYAQILESNGEFNRDNFAVIIKWYLDCDPGIALRDDGSFIALWKDDSKCAPEEEFTLYAKWYNADGIPSEKFKVNDFDCSVYFYKPRVEISPTGGFIIVWTDQRDTWKNGKIRCQMYDANSNPIGANFEVNDPVERKIKCRNPSLGIDGNGNFVVVWDTDLNGNSDIYGKIFNSEGIPYQANFMINDDGGASWQCEPALDVHSDGSFVVTWSDNRNGNYDVFAQRYDSNWNAVGNNFIVNDGGLTSSQSTPAIAFTPDGKFVIAWEDGRNGNNDIYAQKFSADGSKLGGNYRVNDDEDSADQSYPQVDCNSENIYFTWQDNRIPNEDYDIFARVEPFSGDQHLIVIQQPEAGDKWIIGQTNRITWNSSDLGGTLLVELSTDNGYTWKTVSSNTPFDAVYVEYTPATAEIGDHCFIKITSNDFSTVSDLSDRFNIFKPVKRYTAKQFSITSDPIIFDGILSESVWNDAKADSLLFGGIPEEWISQWTNFSDHLVSWKALWSPENNRVYLALEIRDDTRGTLDNNNPNETPFYPFNDESIEIYVDGDRSGGMYEGQCQSAQQWMIIPENLHLLSNYPNPNAIGVYAGSAVQSAVTLGANGNWTVEIEMAIYNSFETEARTLSAGDTIGWDIWCNDSDDENQENNKYVRDHQTGWYYTGQAYKNSDCFGELILSQMVVPVELYSFQAELVRKSVQLIWQTASEANNYGFDVQRSSDAIHFENIGFVPGSGTTNSSRSYMFHDKNVSQPLCYYRLKILDYDGNYSFSSIVQVNLNQPTKFHLYANYPNPFNPETTITYELADAKFVVIKIYNLHGEEVAALVNEFQKPGSYAIVWRTQNVPSGIYLCRMEAGSYRESFKLTILK